MYKVVLLSVFSVLVFCSTVQPKFPKQLKKNYLYVPAGLVVIDKDTLSVQAFYMFSHEITNFQYNEFLFDLEKNGRTADLEIARVRNENWNTNGQHSAPMAEHYHTHPAYRDYPVVNITHEAANMFCVWVTEKLNDPLLKLGVKVKARLPFHAEIIRAGAGDNLGQPYPWKFMDLKNSKGETLCNYQYIPNSTLTRESDKIIVVDHDNAPFSNADVLAPSDSYWTSEFGMFNLSGNAAEMINTPGVAVGGSWRDLGYDVRLQSTKKYEGSAVDVGFRVVVTWLAD